MSTPDRREQEAERARMIENLRLLHDTLERSPLAGRWWMFAGGLLGWAREGNPLLHDLSLIHI